MLDRTGDRYEFWVDCSGAESYEVEVTEITTVRDRSREITDALNSSFGRVDVVLMTGGLGPTKDDITKQTLCDYFGGKFGLRRIGICQCGSHFSSS